MLTYKENSLASVAACVSPCRVPGTLHDYQKQHPRKGLSSVIMVAVW